MAGHSSGGDFAVDTLLRKQTPFSKFIVGSYGTDVLEKNLAAREAQFADLPSAQLSVFCGYGGGEEADPYLKPYIERGIALLQRLEASDPDSLTVTIRGFDNETHGSVFPHIFSSGYRELWGSGISFVEAMADLGQEGGDQRS